MADLSFIEDSVAFPEKEEDEEEEEEGVEWGYEEGNPPHVEGSRVPGQRVSGPARGWRSERLRVPLAHVGVCHSPIPLAVSGQPATRVRLGKLGLPAGQRLAPASTRRARLSLGCDISCLLSSYGEQRYLLLNSLRKQFVKL